MATAPISPNRQHSHLHDLPTPSLLNRSNSSSKSSIGFEDPRMATLYSTPATTLSLPFPRQTSAEFFSRNANSTPSPSTSGPASTYDLQASPPTWPNPASYSFSQAPKKSTTLPPSSKVKSSNLGGNLICFELALGDRLAAKLDRETTLDSIREASGVVSTELTETEEAQGGGVKVLVSKGTASAVQKARQLLDAKLSQTPIRSIVGLKLESSHSSSLTFIPSTGPHISRFQPLSSSTYRLVTSVLPPTARAHPPLARPRLGSFPSTTSIISEFSLPPSSEATTPIVLTPADENESSDQFFSSQSGTTTPIHAQGKHSPSSQITPPATEVPPSLPQIGNFDKLRSGYIKAMVDELEFSVKRRSLVRVKLDIGSQEWRREGSRENLEFGRERWGLEEIENWTTNQSHSPVSPTFSTSLSPSTAKMFLSTLNDGSASLSFDKKCETSQVHILHLDKSRASFGCAIAECRGQELRDLPQGSTASGTLVLKKCSTLPSKPFALSIVKPLSASIRQLDGTDLRLKVLSDKAATSPSLDLSAAMQSATWEVDDLGDFRVKVDLKEERFGKGETEIRWTSRERWENQDGTLRFTIAENRYSDSSKHDFSVELCSPTLNQLLANYALDQAQGKKAKWEREKVRGWIENLIEFGEKFVEKERE